MVSIFEYSSANTEAWETILQGLWRNLSRGRLKFLFSRGGGGQHLLWPENLLKSIDFTGPGLAPIAPPPEYVSELKQTSQAIDSIASYRKILKLFVTNSKTLISLCQFIVFVGCSYFFLCTITSVK